MIKRIATIALAVAVLAGFTLSAAAETFGPWTPKTAPVSQYDSTYVTLGASGFLQNTPNLNYFDSLDSTPLFSESPDVFGGSGGITLGILLDNRRTPSWLGQKPRVEVSFSYSRGSGNNEQSRTFAPAVTAFRFTPVDGTILLGAGCAAGCTTTRRLSVDFEDVSGAIRLKSDIRLTRRLTLTPALGFVGGHSSVKYNIDSLITNVGSFNVTPLSLEEKLKTARLGGEAAADITWKVNGRWTLHGGASIALFRMGTRLKANDCISSLVAPGTPCNGFVQTSVSNFDHQTGYRVGMNSGVTYNGGWFRLTLVGQGVWDSHVPGVLNPTFVTVGAPASIVYSSQWRYGGFVAVAFPF